MCVRLSGVGFAVGEGGKIPLHVLNPLELCSKLQVWYVSTNTYAVS